MLHAAAVASMRLLWSSVISSVLGSTDLPRVCYTKYRLDQTPASRKGKPCKNDAAQSRAMHGNAHRRACIGRKNAIGDALNGAMVEEPMKGADLPFINAVVLGFAQQ